MSNENNLNLKLMTVILKTNQSIENAIRKDVLKYGLNPTEFSALEFLYHKGSMSIQKLNRDILISKSTMSYCLDQLTLKKLINRKTNKEDRRSTDVELSEKGKEFMDKIFPEHKKFLETLFNELTNDEKEALISNLKKVGFKAVRMKEEE